ncbi:MAG TPA: thioredoxin domain-containing protein [Bryobacteraceae bacterium]|jgi:protein-disulfide isomerase|nr:thioredoxin domain-containing protein [Bryobacteraceae bacterium]
MNIALKKYLAAGVFASTLITGVHAANSSPAPANDSVVVVIDGAKLTQADLELKHSANLFQARNSFYDAERKVLDQYIEEYLLDRAAKKEGVTVEELIKRHTDGAAGADPSDDALRVYYEGLDTQESFDTAKDKIREYIKQRRVAKAKAAYLQSLKTTAKIEVELAAPRTQASMKGVPVRGAKDAPVTLIEFADFECPYCQQMEPKLAKLQQEFQGKLAFAYKDFPLPMHSHAEKAAEAAHCAMDQGKFWEYHDLLYSTSKLDVSQLKESARTLNLDGAAFDKCLDSGATAAAVSANLEEAKTLAISGTPGFFVNGRYLEGNVPYENLRSIVMEELGRGPAKPETAKR